MSTLHILSIRRSFVTLAVFGFLLIGAASAEAQFGLGARMAWVTRDVDADDDAVRFVGGQVRFGAGLFGVEVAMDHKSEEFEELNQKITTNPIQASLILRLAGGGFSPYLLGGPGWYRRKVEPIDSQTDVSVQTTEFGWHAGIGLEMRPSRHFGLHGDYRYTFLDFDNDDDGDEGLIASLLPGHKGSMWTAGFSIYF